jgi:predicted nucleic acid-binding protein
MQDKYFIDTNVLVYAHDRSEETKYRQAKRLILDGILNEKIVVSTQVLSEFYVTVTQKIKVKLPIAIAKKEIILLNSIDIVEIDYNLIIQAINVSQNQKLSYWDSLIVAAALKAKCTILYSEDLNRDQIIDGLTIRNPFC